MATTRKEKPATYVKTGKVRLSYVHLFEPYKGADEDEDKAAKYSVCIIIPKKDKDTIKRIKKAIAAATEAGKDSKFKGNTKNVRNPLRDGDEERDSTEYVNSYFINCNSNIKPQVVDLDLEPLRRDEVYSGCWGRVSLNFYPYAMKGNKGIAAGLGNVQKVADGEPLGGVRVEAADDFDDDFDDDDEDFDIEEEEEEAPRKKSKKKEPVEDEEEEDDEEEEAPRKKKKAAPAKKKKKPAYDDEEDDDLPY